MVDKSVLNSINEDDRAFLKKFTISRSLFFGTWTIAAMSTFLGGFMTLCEGTSREEESCMKMFMIGLALIVGAIYQGFKRQGMMRELEKRGLKDAFKAFDRTWAGKGPAFLVFLLTEVVLLAIVFGFIGVVDL